ncbi:MAG: arginine--tRNA ligase, partial [Gammaproteobacteria bacterium]|nr:arginine--tRNA ligase [Gammaproteobacteria bacterium]
MKAQVKQLIENALAQLIQNGDLPQDCDTEVAIDHTRDKTHGDFACNVAMRLAKAAKSNPRELANKVVAAIPASDFIEKIDIAGPGFINFKLSETASLQIISNVHEQGTAFGTSSVGEGKKIQIEFVSANPTGPLHVGHGRGAAYGAVVANLLSAVGFDVSKEYYVNDAGRQMDILAASVWLRYLEICGETVTFPSNAYKGDYIVDIARKLFEGHSNQFHVAGDKVFEDVPADENEQTPDGDKEAHIDGLIAKAKTLLPAKDYHTVFGAGLNSILEDIRDDLAEFGVTFDEWFSERSLMDSNDIEQAIEKLKANDYVYEKNGALWFKSTEFRDEKDRVIVRDNGQSTYFASDIAYHNNKFNRGFVKCLDIWGADHHGYVSRVKGAIKALGKEPKDLDILLVQFAVLYRSGEKVQMSTRSGQFVTLRELREEVGNDAARFFYVMRKCEQHLDFDLDLAKSRSNENPVYYIQYAHARICSVFRELDEKNLHMDMQAASNQLTLLKSEHEENLARLLTRFPEVVENGALNYEPHLIPHYLRELANGFHTYYNAQKFIVDDENLRNA